MKRKNTPHPNPLDLLNNLQHRRSQYQKLQITTKSNRPVSKRFQRIHTDDNLHEQSFRPSIPKYSNIQVSVDTKREIKSLSSQKNKSLKQIYCKTMILSPNQKKKQILLSKTPKSQFKHQYSQILDILSPPVQKDLNQLILQINQKLDNVIERFQLDKFIQILFSKIKIMIGTVFQKTILNSLSQIAQQQRQFNEQYKLLYQQNNMLNAKIKEIEEDQKLLSDDMRKIAKISEEQFVCLSDKMRKQKQLNQLIYQLRMNGVDIDNFYIKMRHPSYDSRYSQQSFSEKHLRKCTI